MINYTRGTVTRVIKPKGYGFLKLADGRTVFFLLSEGGKVAVEAEGPQYGIVPVGGDCPIPKKGDELAFVQCEGPKGLRANPWTHAAELDAAQAEIDRLPTYRVVRVKWHRGKVVSNQISSTVIWEGNNVQDLVEHYPLTNCVNDLFAPRMSNGIEISFRFFRKVENDWVPCRDPRVEAVQKAA